MISIPLVIIGVIFFIGGLLYVTLTISGIRLKLRQNPDNEELALLLKRWKRRFWGLFLISVLVINSARYLDSIGW
jgi:hypothetical protein